MLFLKVEVFLRTSDVVVLTFCIKSKKPLEAPPVPPPEPPPLLKESCNSLCLFCKSEKLFFKSCTSLSELGSTTEDIVSKLESISNFTLYINSGIFTFYLSDGLL